MSALISFLGGSAFRLIWDRISGWLEARQDHKQEIERLRVQAEMEAAAHVRNIESIRLQSELGIKVIESQREADVAGIEAGGWAAAVAQAQKPTGVFFVDAWNGIIRPGAASVALGLWVFALAGQGWQMTEWDRSLVGVVLGFYFAARSIFVAKRT